MLSHDTARCAGVYDEGWREGCDDCLRRTEPGNPDRQAHMAPPLTQI